MLEAAAIWEHRNGTLASITPSEYTEFCEFIASASVKKSARQYLEEITQLRQALHEIAIEAENTIPPDGEEAAFAALHRILDIILPFRKF